MDAEDQTTPQSEPSAEEIAAAPEIASGASLGAIVGGPDAIQVEEAPQENVSGPRVSVGYPGDRFDSGVSGVSVIGYRTPVSKAKLKQVQSAADEAGVRLVVED